MLNILSHEGNTNQMILRFNLSKWLKLEVQTTTHVVEYMEQKEYSSIARGRANMYSNFVNQYGRFSENWESICFKTKLYHS